MIDQTSKLGLNEKVPLFKFRYWENIKINLDGYFSSNVDMLREIKVALIAHELWSTLCTFCLCFSPFLEFYNIIFAFSQANLKILLFGFNYSTTQRKWDQSLRKHQNYNPMGATGVHHMEWVS